MQAEKGDSMQRSHHSIAQLSSWQHDKVLPGHL